EKQKGSRGIRRGQWYRLVFQFPIRVLLSIRKQHKSMYNIGFPQPRSDGFPVILHKFDSTDAFKISLP
ncbi:hypothetical protein RZR42_25625, partial [Escherichia coli]|uniref:hypothetical protein n=1 Tax=Escherichia coli TaxID=562 RepID=UPI00292C1149